MSRVFRGGSVAPQRRAEILKVAKALGYRPEAMARAIMTRRSGIVGILISVDTNLNRAALPTTLCHSLAMLDMRAVVFVVGSTPEIDEAIDQALAYRVDGVIALIDIAADHADALSRIDSILVLYNQEIEGAEANWVGCDHELDGDMLARHMAARSATTFWILEGPETSLLATQRLAGLVRGLRSSPGQISIERDSNDLSSESAFKAVARRLTAGQDEPHAITVVNAMMAIGAIAALHAAGCDASDKIIIASLDGSLATSWPSFETITIAQPHLQLAAAAVEIIAVRLHDHPDRLERRTISSTLSSQ